MTTLQSAAMHTMPAQVNDTMTISDNGAHVHVRQSFAGALPGTRRAATVSGLIVGKKGVVVPAAGAALFPWHDKATDTIKIRLAQVVPDVPVNVFSEGQEFNDGTNFFRVHTQENGTHGEMWYMKSKEGIVWRVLRSTTPGFTNIGVLDLHPFSDAHTAELLKSGRVKPKGSVMSLAAETLVEDEQTKDGGAGNSAGQPSCGECETQEVVRPTGANAVQAQKAPHMSPAKLTGVERVQLAHARLGDLDHTVMQRSTPFIVGMGLDGLADKDYTHAGSCGCAVCSAIYMRANARKKVEDKPEDPNVRLFLDGFGPLPESVWHAFRYALVMVEHAK
jgi:hypothetical protein